MKYEWVPLGPAFHKILVLRGSLTFKFNIFIIQFREKCSKQNMKKTVQEIVFVCEDFPLNCKENELHRKYKVLGGPRKIFGRRQF